MLLQLTSLTLCDPRVSYNQVWKGIHSPFLFSQHTLPRISFRHHQQGNVCKWVRRKGHAWLRKGLWSLSFNKEQDPTKCQLKTDTARIWKNIYAHKSCVLLHMEKFMFLLQLFPCTINQDTSEVTNVYLCHHRLLTDTQDLQSGSEY